MGRVAANVGRVTDATYRFDTFGSLFDTVLHVHDGDSTGAELGCNNDTVGLTSQVSVTLAARQNVIIVVDGCGGGYGPFTLHIN